MDDEAVLLAAILTGIQFHVIESRSPGTVMVGNQAGTGKGHLIDLIGAIVKGSPVPSYAYTSDGGGKSENSSLLSVFRASATSTSTTSRPGVPTAVRYSTW